MTKCYMPLQKQCDDGKVCKSKKPTATVIPTTMQPFSTVMPSKCPAIYLAREKEEEIQKVFSTALQLYKANEVMLSFNGGKDCTVVLHALHNFFKNKALEHIKLPVLYIQQDDSFPEIDLFVEESLNFYDINLIKRKGCIKNVLEDVLKEMPQIKAIFMGSRRTDPHCEDLKIMQTTDPGWPKIMRINPLLDWTYIDIWTYIFIFKVPYCVLYEMGYTSIGTRKNTQPNPLLKAYEPVPSCTPKYHPAYFLEDPCQERAGRFKPEQKGQ